MARKLLENSSQVFLATIVDLNNIPVAASAITMEGKLFTTNKSEWPFEVNRGATVGCSIYNDMLLFTVEPKLKPGTIRAYTMLHTGSTTDPMGITDAENTQDTDIQIVPTGTNIATKQGPLGIIIKLNTFVSDKSQMPWSLPGKSVQAIRDEMNKIVQSSEFIDILEKLGVADNKLKNVKSDVLKQK